MSSNNNKSTGKTDTTSDNKSISFNQAVRDAGFRNFNAFLQSYGLKIHDHDDILEGKAILRGLFPGASF
ncbi:hypothetical protein Vi05172_g12724 [Venturia inaequalis]|nr:hypothetical protein Vi05172_g12724 [Venturia inaequalis]